MAHRPAPRIAAALSLIVLLALAPTVGALLPAQELADFVGDWEIEMAGGGGRGGGPQVLTFTLDADGNLEGTWGRGELTDVKFADGKVTFKRAFGGGGRGGGGGRPAGTMASEVTLEAGKLVGTMESPRGSIEFAGARKDS